MVPAGNKATCLLVCQQPTQWPQWKVTTTGLQDQWQYLRLGMTMQGRNVLCTKDSTPCPQPPLVTWNMKNVTASTSAPSRQQHWDLPAADLQPVLGKASLVHEPRTTRPRQLTRDARHSDTAGSQVLCLLTASAKYVGVSALQPQHRPPLLRVVAQ